MAVTVSRARAAMPKGMGCLGLDERVQVEATVAQAVAGELAVQNSLTKNDL